MQKFILGGYTRRLNQGIHEIGFDENTGQFAAKELIAQLQGPTYVCLSADRDYLFSLQQEEDAAGIAAFRLNEEGQYQELDRLLASAGPGCHLSYRDQSQTIYDASYHAGAITVYQLVDDQLKKLQELHFEGSSVHPNQASSHVHFTGLNADESLLFMCDLGTDKVHVFDVLADGQLQEKAVSHMPAGTGPRHLVLHPNGRYVYIIGELANTCLVGQVNDAGQITIIQSEVNIPADYTESSAGAAIRLSQDGRFLYLSTRFHNAITVYQLSQEGDQITKVQEIDSQGEIPRDFNFDATQNYLLVAHQDSDRLSVFKREDASGKLEFLHQDQVAEECVCIADAN